MKRSGKEHGQSSIKRIKSQEDCFEECHKPRQQEEPKASPTSRTCISKLSPGFGFTRDTKQYYCEPKATKRVNGKRGCKNKAQTKARRTAPHVVLSGEADRSLETDTLDIPTYNDIQKGDQADNAGINVEQVYKSIPRNQLNHTYPPWRKPSNLQDNDLEMDIIIPKQSIERQLLHAPSKVPEDYSDMKAKEINKPLVRLPCVGVDILARIQHPEHKSVVQIHHEYKGETLHDDFGAELKTYKTTIQDGKIYYRHIFYNVEPGATAAEMKIRNNHEIVLINGIFVPDLTHQQVINIIRDIKVDGETRFELVIRYVDKEVKKPSWVWFKTSAILSPDDDHHSHGDNHPNVEDERFKVLPDNQTEMESTCRFRVKGTKYFIVIEDNKVGVSVTPYNIRITSRFKQDDSGNVIFTATLCAVENKNYIAVSGRKIIIKHTPFWFRMSQISTDYAFICDDKHLAYDAKNHMLTTATGKTQFLFEEWPVDGDGLDEVDAAVASTSTSDAAEHVKHDEHTANDEEGLKQHSKLVLTSSQNNDDASFANSFHTMSQCSSLSDIQYADESASGSMTSSQSLTSSQSSSRDEMELESSGYLTSGSLDLNGTNDIELSLFENKPKTPNTPMAGLSINDLLKNRLTS